MQTLPLLNKHNLDSKIALADGKIVSCADFIGQAYALSDKFPDSKYLIQLCDEPYYFLLSFAAALIKQKTMILPPNKAPDAIEELCLQYTDSQIICDKEIAEIDKSINCSQIHDYMTATEIPQINAEHICVILHTSGTTGQPRAHSKTWKSLVKGCEVTGISLDIPKGCYCLSTVPPQHMYGLETSIMFVLQQGGISINQMPVFPADIVEILDDLPQPRILITTPIQLNAIVDTTTTFPDCEFVLSATAPLTSEIAKNIESLCKTTVKEIYGSTETGAIATRKTATELLWMPNPNIQFERKGNEWEINATHFTKPQLIADQLEFEGHKFLVTGRNSDFIKISGKRGSLAQLNVLLNSIDGIDDGLFYMTDSSSRNTQRVSAVVVSKTLKKKQIISLLRRKLDPVFLPRPLVIVEEIPRNTLGKLSRQDLEKLIMENS